MLPTGKVKKCYEHDMCIVTYTVEDCPICDILEDVSKEEADLVKMIDELGEEVDRCVCQ